MESIQNLLENFIMYVYVINYWYDFKINILAGKVLGPEGTRIGRTGSHLMENSLGRTVMFFWHKMNGVAIASRWVAISELWNSGSMVVQIGAI
jgi:hypothetical protein